MKTDANYACAPLFLLLISKDETRFTDRQLPTGYNNSYIQYINAIDTRPLIRDTWNLNLVGYLEVNLNLVGYLEVFNF